MYLRTEHGGSCPHPGSGQPGRGEPLKHHQSRTKHFTVIEVAIPLGTPVLSELGLGAGGKRR